MDILISILNKAGIGGLLLVMAIEGLSIPFPGIIIILTLSFILNLNIMQIFLISGIMSLVYSTASYIPYRIGYRLEKTIIKKYEAQIKKVQHYFQKYGVYSIALLRPFAAGNYISYFAGMNRIKLLKYILLTFIGIYPWCFVMLLIGRLSKGNTNYGMKLVQSYAVYFYIFVSLMILIYGGITIFRYIMNKSNV